MLKRIPREEPRGTESRTPCLSIVEDSTPTVSRSSQGGLSDTTRITAPRDDEETCEGLN